MGSSRDGRAGVVFAALADPTRRRVVDELASAGPLTGTELAGRLPVSRQAVAKHLAALESAGLATARRSGREARYGLSTKPFAQAEAWMAAIGATWEHRLQHFKQFVETEEQR
jgi:ArsR family transcriptional regulator, cadmium/lead-responsive transcriptional repressor